MTEIIEGDLMDVAETAALLRTSTAALYVLRSRAKAAGDPTLAPPDLRLGRRVLYSRAAVLRWLAEQQ